MTGGVDHTGIVSFVTQAHVLNGQRSRLLIHFESGMGWLQITTIYVVNKGLRKATGWLHKHSRRSIKNTRCVCKIICT